MAAPFADSAVYLIAMMIGWSHAKQIRKGRSNMCEASILDTIGLAVKLVILALGVFLATAILRAAYTGWMNDDRRGK